MRKKIIYKKIWIGIKAMGEMLQGYDWKEWDNEYILGNYLREQSSLIYVCQDKSNPQHRNLRADLIMDILIKSLKKKEEPIKFQF